MSEVLSSVSGVPHHHVENGTTNGDARKPEYHSLRNEFGAIVRYLANPESICIPDLLLLHAVLCVVSHGSHHWDSELQTSEEVVDRVPTRPHVVSRSFVIRSA